jgi:hypothetical protein
VEAGSDPHPKVKEAAKQALIDISSVIRYLFNYLISISKSIYLII